MKHLKTYKLFESNIDDFEDNVRDILLELEDEGLQIEIDRTRKDVEGKKHSEIIVEVRIMRPFDAPDRVIPGVAQPPGGKYPGNLFFWYEIKDTIIRLTEWYYSEGGYESIDKNSEYRWEKDKSPLRFFGSGVEMCIGNSKEEDFRGIGDYISFSNFRITIKL